MRVVLDANQFVSAVLVPTGHPGQILTAWRQNRFVLALSPAILLEIRRVLNYPRLRKKHGWSSEEIEEFLGRLAAAAEIVPDGPDIRVVVEDPSDDAYIACAITAGARCIVTGDEHLKRIRKYQGIEILSPSDFLSDVLGVAPRNRPRGRL